jgi:hypothetical protein
MSIGKRKMEYIFHAEEPSIVWCEAKAVQKANARSMAIFIYKDLICRFGCISYISVDGESKFKKKVTHLLKILY